MSENERACVWHGCSKESTPLLYFYLEHTILVRLTIVGYHCSGPLVLSNSLAAFGLMQPVSVYNC